MLSAPIPALRATMLTTRRTVPSSRGSGGKARRTVAGAPPAASASTAGGYSVGAETASATELWIGKTLVSPVILKILRIFSWVQTSCSEPS